MYKAYEKVAQNFSLQFIKSLCVIFAVITCCLGNIGSKPTEVKEHKEKFLVSVIFEDKSSCIGALVGPLIVATSNICLDKYSFSSRIYKNPCKVYAGVQTFGKDMGIWRHCVGIPKYYKSDEEGEDNFYYSEAEDIKHIEIDLPFDTYIVHKASVGIPNFEKKEQCTVFGYNTDDKDSKRDSLVKTTSTAPPGKEEASDKRKRQDTSSSDADKTKVKNSNDTNRVLLQNTAIILPLKECKETYREYMDDILPKGQFCVAEGGIKDKGRILICDGKVVGVVADDIIITYTEDGIIFAYTSVKAGSLRVGPSCVLILISLFYYACEIASVPFKQCRKLF